MRGLTTIAVILLSTVTAIGQTSSTRETDLVLMKGDIVDGNLQTAMLTHVREDPDFHISKQIPEDKRESPPWLVKQDGSFDFDWTLGQHARYLMEDIRQGVHALQSAEKSRGLDAIALAGAREYWPKLRDISCGDAPGTKYYDLDGFAQFCPNR